MQNMAGVSDGGSHIVRNHDYGDAVLTVELFDERIHFRRHLGVKSRNRLIQKQHFLCGAQRAGQQHPLLLPAGQLAIAPPCEPGDLHFLHGVHRKIPVSYTHLVNLLPIWFFWDTYYDFALASGMEQSYIDSYVRYYTSPGWLAFILLFTTLMGLSLIHI